MSADTEHHVIFHMEEYLNKVPSEVKSQTFVVNSKFWDILRRASSKDETINKYFKMMKLRLATANIFNLKFVFITIIEETKNNKNWSMLVLCNLANFGDEKPNSNDDERFQVLLFANKIPKNFPICILTLNKFLIVHHNERKHTDISMTHSIVCSTDVVKMKLTVNVSKGVDLMFGYLAKKFKVALKISKSKSCLSCGQRLSKASRAGSCDNCKSNQTANSVSNGSNGESYQQESSKTVKLILIPPYCAAIEMLRKPKDLESGSKHKLSPTKPERKSFQATSAFDVPKAKIEDDCEARELDLERAISTSPNQSNVSKQDSIFETLSDEDQEDSNPKEHFYLSKSGEKFPFTKTDLRGLRPDEWLNDSILNFYLQYTLDQATEAVQKKVYLVNSYFYPRLVVDFDNSLEQKKNCIRPWKQTKDVSEYEYLAIPINENAHWFLVIAKLPLANSAREPRCTIFVLDSMLDGDEDHAPIANKVTAYIFSRIKGQKAKRFGSMIQARDLKVPEVPQQKNGSDCGLFVLEYFEQFLKVLEHGRSVNDINFEGWFKSNALRGKRLFILRLIQSLRPESAQNGHHTNGKKRKSNAANSSPAKKFLAANRRLNRSHASVAASPRQ